jgi:hypothetical protein
VPSLGEDLGRILGGACYPRDLDTAAHVARHAVLRPFSRLERLRRDGITRAYRPRRARYASAACFAKRFTALRNGATPRVERELRLAGVVLDEIAVFPAEPLGLPHPRESHVRRIADAMLADLADDRPLGAWAAEPASRRVRRLAASPQKPALDSRSGASGHAHCARSNGLWRLRL